MDASAVDGDETKRQFQEAVLEQRTERCVLRLYVTGSTLVSSRAIQRVRRVCEERLHGRYDLEVFDIYRVPARARDDQVVATPTLIRVRPTPVRRLIGDLSKVDSALFGSPAGETVP